MHPVMYPGEESIAFDAAIGKAISQWAFVEIGMAAIVSFICSDTDKNIIDNSFKSIENFRSKLEFANKCVEFSDLDLVEKERWRILRNEIISLSAKRNKIAHGRVWGFPAAPPGRRYAILPKYESKSKIQPRQGIPPNDSMCLKDVYRAFLEFSNVYVKEMSFYSKISNADDVFEYLIKSEVSVPDLPDIVDEIYAFLPRFERGGR